VEKEMSGARPAERFWFIDLEPQEAQIRCILRRLGKSVTGFTVQLEIQLGGHWTPVVRFDNAHGFSHRDTIHPEGTKEKTRIYVGDLNATFTFAIAEIKAKWRDERARYVGEIQS
jgi:hypothetical protein